MVFRRFAVLLVIVACMGSAPLLADTIVTSNNARVDVLAGGNGVTDYRSVESPGIARLHVDNGLGASSSMDVVFSKEGGQTVFDFDFEQTRTGGGNDAARANGQWLYFEVTENTTYALSGHYNVEHSGSSGSVQLKVYLQDLTTDTWLFDEFQWSRFTGIESFGLGGSGGDTSNRTVGSLDGELVAGNQYRLYFNMITQAVPDGDDGATADGRINLTIGTQQVPTPSSFAALVGMGLMGLVVVRRRRKK